MYLPLVDHRKFLENQEAGRESWNPDISLVCHTQLVLHAEKGLI